MRSVRYHVLAGLVLAAAFAFPASAASGETFVVDSQQPFEHELTNPCTGELFFTQGWIHERLYVSVTDDGRTHVTGHINLQGVEGLTLTGVRYIVQRNDDDHFIVDSDFMPFNSHVTFREHYVRLKSDGTLEQADDFYAYFRFQLTVNANGTTTVDRMETDEECN